MNAHPHVWSLSDGGDDSLGLSFTPEGLVLGRTPLLERHDGHFEPRPQAELERLLSHGFGIEAKLDRVMPGLATVSSALDRRDLCRASIAAVHLRIPDLPDPFARLAMETEDLLIKVEARADRLMRGDWDPAEHPRAGTSPNPGWFASTDGGDAEPDANADKDKPLRLPPGERNDEIGDLLEWIANAKPEDVQAISGEISRIFYANSDFADGAALHQALIEVLADPDRANRERILDQLEPISHHDPSAEGAVVAETGIITGFRSPGRGAEISAPAAEAVEAASDVWKLGWAARGLAIDKAFGNTLGRYFPVIDSMENGVATSIKSIDLNSATYQDGQRLLSRINNYSFQLSEFQGAVRGTTMVRNEDIQSRVLNVVIPKGSITAEQQAAVDAARAQAKQYGVTLIISPY